MYEEYSRQALPTKRYRELLGSAICVFNANTSFIIENILRSDTTHFFNWYALWDRTAGQLASAVKDTITAKSDDSISNLFSSLCDKRNRIVHSFQITDSDGEQRLATKDKSNNQYVITEEFLLDFIKENETLCNMLYKFRGF